MEEAREALDVAMEAMAAGASEVCEPTLWLMCIRRYPGEVVMCGWQDALTFPAWRCVCLQWGARVGRGGGGDGGGGEARGSQRAAGSAGDGG
jgi:hypothetical protein